MGSSGTGGMSETVEAEAAGKSEERIAIDRLRKLQESVEKVGKKTVDNLFELGAAFEEAAGLLHGRFSAWVVHECRIEPRTVLGYRRLHTVLGHRRKDFKERRIAPSVLIRIASAPQEVRDRALAIIDRGRDLKLSDLKALSLPRSAPSPLASMRTALVSAARVLASEIETLAASPETQATIPSDRVKELTAAVAAMLPGSPLADALRELAEGSKGGLAAAIDSFGAAPPAAPDASECPSPTVPAAPKHKESHAERYAKRFERTAFSHGLTAIEICAGAGGQAHGLTRAGFKHVAMVEHDPIACSTLRAAFPSANVLEADLKEVDLSAFAGIDLLAGGPPCTPYSQAGLRGGAKDPSDLMPRAIELVETLRPRAVLLENVPGMFDRGNDLHRLDLLGRLMDSGYRCEWRTVKAWEFGVPQQRKRAILVGFREPAAMARFSWPAPAPVSMDEFYDMSCALYHHLRDGGYEPSEELEKGLSRLSPTLTGGSPNKDGADLGQDNSKRPWREMGIDPGGVALRAPGPDHVGPPKLSIRMVAALQGFHGDWPFQGSKVPQFKQIVNAFPPIVALHLGCAVASALTGEHQDYNREVQRLATSLRMKTWRDPSLPAPAALDPTVPGTPSGAAGSRVSLDLRKLAQQGRVEFEADSALRKCEAYPAQAFDEEAEAEHYVAYWETIRAVHAIQAGMTSLGKSPSDLASVTDGARPSA